MTKATKKTDEPANALKLVQQKLGKTYEDLEFLLDALSEVLTENGEKEMADQIPWISQAKPFEAANWNMREYI